MLYKLFAQRISTRHLYRSLQTVTASHIGSGFFNPALYYSSISDDKLDVETIRLLERLSLVNFENEKYVTVVEEAITFANGINAVDTDNVEPLVSVLEDRNLKLREDIVTDGNCRQKVLQNAAKLEEEYFVAPPGNIPVNLNAKEK